MGLVAVCCRAASLSTAAITANNKNHPPKVRITLAMESLCPGCQELMLRQLFPIVLGPPDDYADFYIGLDYIDLTVLPFGNAMAPPSSSPNNTNDWQCQHGPGECDANVYEQCAIFLYRDTVPRYLPFLKCLDETLPMGYHNESFPTTVFAQCAQHAALDVASLQACHDNTTLVQELQESNYQQTLALNHSYVPWIVVNDEPHDEATETNLLSSICHILQQQFKKDAVLPRPCQNMFHTTTTSTTLDNNDNRSVCPKETTPFPLVDDTTATTSRRRRRELRGRPQDTV